MISIVEGNVLDVETGIIVHGCNNKGVMGAGIALEIKNRFPEVFHAYKTAERSGLKLGSISFAEVVPGKKIIVNAVTQTLGGLDRAVSYDAIADSFTNVLTFARTLQRHRNVSYPILFPKIGAGLGGGNWNIISAIIDVVIPDEFQKVLYVLP